MKPDIKNRIDVELLVNTFYNKVKTSKILGYIFDDVAKINWETHLPKMYSFWSSILLDEHSFTGNPMQKHAELNKLTPLSQNEFDEWITLFNNTVDSLFSGEKADEAKTRAANIARLMLFKIQNS